MSSFDPNSLIYLSLIFFVIGTAIQLLAMWRTKASPNEDQKQFKTLLSGDDPPETVFGTNDPIVFEKVDEQTFRKIDRIMKGSY